MSVTQQELEGRTRNMSEDNNVETNELSNLEQKSQENERLFQQLTNKNREYMVKLNRQLDEGNINEDQKTKIFNDMLKNIVEQQENHITARRLYGTVTDQARYILENPNQEDAESEVRSEPWKLYIDGALLLGGMFAIITGVSYFAGNNEAGLGLVTMLLNFLLGGLAVMIITKYAPVPGQKGGFLKYIVATTITMLVWILLMSFGALAIPDAINPFIPGPYTLGIGALALLAKWYLKRELNIKGTLI